MDKVAEKFERLHPTLHIVGEASKDRNGNIEIHCDICGQNFTRKRYAIATNRTDIGCPVCSNKPVVKGYNDIATTAHWMVKYLKNKEDAYKYTWGSHKKVITKCPVCGFEKEMTIKNLYYQGFKCYKCDSAISFPNRVARSLLEALQIDYISEYSPQWCGKYAYDFYFKIGGMEYIIEMDGGLGHGNSDFKHKQDIIGIKRDKIKDDLASKHSLDVIRIDCKKSEMDYIKKNIISSKLSEIFDLSQINWDEVFIKATDNLFLQICDYYNQGHIAKKDLCNKFKVSNSTIVKALHICNDLGLCVYNQEVRHKHAGKISLNAQLNKEGYHVILYDLDNTYVGEFINGTSCARKIMELHPELNLTKAGITGAIYRNTIHYKGFTIIRKDKQEQ